MDSNVTMGWWARLGVVAVALVTSGGAGCRRAVVCQPNEDLDPTSGMCLRLCTDEVAPGIPCRSDGGTFEAGPRDAASDAREGGGDGGDVVSPLADGSTDGPTVDPATIEAPRPVAPLSLSVTQTDQPTFRWDLRAPNTGAVIELCRDRAMTLTCTREVATGSSLRISRPLARGGWFWRIAGRQGDVEGDLRSAVWFLWSSGRTGSAAQPALVYPDVTGDGIADLVVRGGLDAPSADGGTTRTDFVEIYAGRLGGSPVAHDQRIPAQGASLRPMAVADVTGDGVGDVLVGDPEAASGRGVLRVFGGGPLPLVQVAEIASPDTGSSGFGQVVDAVGDLNGDGFVDVVVQAPGRTLSFGENRTHVFMGERGGISPRPIRSFQAASNELIPWVGGCDVTGDGLSDLSLAPTMRAGAGRSVLQVFAGDSVVGIVSSPRTVEATAGDGSLWQIGCVGDADGDGFNDVVVTDPTAQPGWRLVFLRGSSTGLTSSDTRSVNGAFGGGAHSIVGAAAGDIDSDGRADALVSWVGTLEPSVPQSFVAVAPQFEPARGLVVDGIPTTRALSVYLGFASRTVGDLDGDGWFDFAFVRNTPATAFPSGMELHFRWGVPAGVSTTRRDRLTRASGVFGHIAGL
jgi:hypothetical protein